jgi:hypothetical protein
MEIESGHLELSRVLFAANPQDSTRSASFRSKQIVQK